MHNQPISQMPTVLVTDAAGFIGAHVVRGLKRRNFGIRAIRSTDECLVGQRAALDGAQKGAEKLDPDIEYLDVDLADSDAVAGAVKGCQGVIHLAGYAPEDGLDIRGARRRGLARMRNLFEACVAHDVARVVYLSSATTLGNMPADPERGLDEDDYYVPGAVQNAYFEAKWAMEAETYRYMLRGCGAVIVIPGWVIGPGGAEAILEPLITRLARGRLAGRTERTLNLVDARDLAETMVKALERGRAGRRYVVGGQNLGSELIVGRILEATGQKRSALRVPPGTLRHAARVGESLSRRLNLDASGWMVAADLLALSQPLDDERARAELSHTSRSWTESLDAMLDALRARRAI